MSFASLVNIAKASKAVQVGTKIAKGLWTLTEIADAGLDVYLLSNEIAKALGVTNPEIKKLIEQVTEKGVEYDTIMEEVTQANTDITNLVSAISSLYGISADFTERQGLAFEQSQKLDTLKSQLNGSIPTTYTWFENSALPDGSLSSETNQQVEAIQEQLGPDYLHIGIASAGLGLRAMFLSYSLYKKRKSGQDVEIPSLRRQQAVVFDGADLEALDNVSSLRKKTFTTLMSGVSKYGKIMLKGVDKLITVGSFGFGIYTLIQQKKAEDEMQQSLEEMFEGYKSDIEIYNWVLNGCKNEDGSIDETAREAVAKEFEIDLADESDEAEKTLDKGYQGVLSEYDVTIDDLIEYMDAAYQSMIEQFEKAQIDSEDSEVVAKLKISSDNFNKLKGKGKDENLASDQRKTALDEIRDGFSDSVAQQMKEINQELTVAIANHKSLSILEPYAEGITTKWQAIGLPLPPSEQFIQLEAATVKSTLDIAYPDRDQLKTEGEILEGLNTLIAELQKTSAVPA